MGVREVIRGLIADSMGRTLPPVTPRRLQLGSMAGKADVVVGMRRSGKTYFLYQLIHDLIAGGTPRERVLYLNFEDERLLPLAARELHLVTDLFYGRFPSNRDHRCWLFFDEIQNVPDWERYVRRLLDTENVRVVLTGSSARLLSREIATSMRGRSLSKEILPFSFAEALSHRGHAVPVDWPPPARDRSRLEHEFHRYLDVGGLPEVQLVDPEVRLATLQEYVNVVLFRDVVERHEVTNLPALRYLVKRLVSTPAGKFSIHKIHNDLRSQGLRAGKDALHEYLAHLEDAYLLFSVQIHAQSERARMVNPRKVYLVDPALAAAFSLGASRDTGHLLENLVYLELRRRGYTTSYVVTKSGHEVDFIASRPTTTPLLVQACADLGSRETRERELRALEEAMRAHRLREGTIVTLGEEDSIQVAAGEVQVQPAWRWLLNL